MKIVYFHAWMVWKPCWWIADFWVHPNFQDIPASRTSKEHHSPWQILAPPEKSPSNFDCFLFETRCRSHWLSEWWIIGRNFVTIFDAIKTKVWRIRFLINSRKRNRFTRFRYSRIMVFVYGNHQWIMLDFFLLHPPWKNDQHLFLTIQTRLHNARMSCMWFFWIISLFL